MIFACDLDRTLLYSRSFITSENERHRHSIVEYKNDLPLSYMSDKAIQLLKALSKKIDFIPVTSRSIEQYKRIELFKNTIIPPVSIVCNGGVILRNGNIDLHWQKIVQNNFTDIIPPSVLMKACEFFLAGHDIKAYRCCDEIFVYAVLKHSEIDLPMFDELTSVCKNYGYHVFRSGRKIYILPYFLDKFAPIKYIMEQCGKEFIAAAGDSILDLPILQNAVHSYIPLHGELSYENITTHKFVGDVLFTKGSGLLASEEILDAVNNIDLFSNSRDYISSEMI